MADEIWYIYRRSDGVYMGSGTPYYDTAEYGSTLVECGEYDSTVEIPVWDGEQWINTPL